MRAPGFEGRDRDGRADARGAPAVSDGQRAPRLLVITEVLPCSMHAPTHGGAPGGRAAQHTWQPLVGLGASLASL